LIPQERFSSEPSMVEKLILILQRVISNVITSSIARIEFNNVLSSPEHHELLQYILKFVPDPENASNLYENEEMAEEDAAAPSDVSITESISPKDALSESYHSDPGTETKATTQLISKIPSQPRQQHTSRSSRYRRFSDQEKAQIMDGVKRFGMGSRNLWRRILSSYKFDRRSAVDIKDAYRTMQRAAWKLKKVALDQRTPSRRSILDFTPFPSANPNQGAAGPASSPKISRRGRGLR
jgi:hypothetical protein